MTVSVTSTSENRGTWSATRACRRIPGAVLTWYERCTVGRMYCGLNEILDKL